MTNPRNLKKLIELQKLGSARLEQALAAANARKGALDEEREALIAMQDRRYDGDALNIDPSLLIKRPGITPPNRSSLSSVSNHNAKHFCRNKDVSSCWKIA